MWSSSNSAHYATFFPTHLNHVFFFYLFFFHPFYFCFEVSVNKDEHIFGVTKVLPAITAGYFYLHMYCEMIWLKKNKKNIHPSQMLLISSYLMLLFCNKFVGMLKYRLSDNYSLPWHIINHWRDRSRLRLEVFSMQSRRKQRMPSPLSWGIDL